jgi:hypothetical protein
VTVAGEGSDGLDRDQNRFDKLALVLRVTGDGMLNGDVNGS